MADSSIVAVKNYLNSYYGGHSQWVEIETDQTGTELVSGIVRAFQISNGLSSPTGEIGPATLAKMKSLAPIKLMDPNDASDPNVCLIQCALFAKGYNAGGITGVYYKTGEAAVKLMQIHAGLESTGIIDWKVWYGLLSFYWFKKVFGGDDNIREIQRNLNGDYSDYIGVGPCDGIMQRHTALGILAALQLESGVLEKEWISDLNQLNFGPITKEAFPGSLRKGRNTTSIIPYNKLAQYALYYNGFEPGNFDGTFDETMRQAVIAFQEFAALDVSGAVVLGEVNAATMHSLLDSRGDPDRNATACDCATVLNKQQALDLRAAGYTHVGRYLTGSVGNDFIPKFITQEEARNIENAGLAVFPIYQDGGYYLDYFKDDRQGFSDAHTAILAAKRIGIPKGTTLYFAVDFDAYGYQISEFIIPYFRRLYSVFKSSYNDMEYKIGVYGPRYICSQLGDKQWTDSSFVAGMSTKFSCNLGYPLPKNWAFDQFHEYAGTESSPAFPSSPSFPLDKVANSGRDKGFKKFDKVPEKTDEELEKENEQVRVENERKAFIYNFADPLGFLDKILDISLTYNQEIPLDTIPLGNGIIINTSALISTSLKYEREDEFSFGVDIDQNGELTVECKKNIETIKQLILDMSKEGDVSSEVLISKQIDNIEKTALAVKGGYLHYEITPSGNSITIEVTAENEDVVPEDKENVNQAISVGFKFEIIYSKDIDYNDEAYQEAFELFAVALIVMGLIMSAPGWVVGLLGNLGFAII